MHYLRKLTRHTCHCWFFALFFQKGDDDCPFHFQRVNPKSEAWYISKLQADCQKKQSPVVSDDVPLERETDDREQAHQSEMGLNRLENLTPTETKKRGMAEFAFTEKKNKNDKGQHFDSWCIFEMTACTMTHVPNANFRRAKSNVNFKF